MTSHESIQILQKKMNQAIIGQENIVERLIIGLLANGNLLVEGLTWTSKDKSSKSHGRCHRV